MNREDELQGIIDFQAKEIKDLKQKHKESMNLLGEWEKYLEEHKIIIEKQAKRINEFEKEIRSARAKYDIYKVAAERIVSQKSKN